MLAWADESGDDWDMKIAEDLFSRWFDAAFQKAPDAGTGVINLLGTSHTLIVWMPLHLSHVMCWTRILATRNLSAT